MTNLEGLTNMALRKIGVFVLATAMVLGGVYLVGAELLTSRVLYFRLVIGGVILTTMGTYLLWTDFVAPALGIKTSED